MLVEHIRNFLHGTASYLEKPLDKYVDLATPDGEDSFATETGDLATIFAVVGTREMRDVKSTIEAALQLDQQLRTNMDNPGHSLEFNYVSDPERGPDAVLAAQAPARVAAQAIGLDWDALLNAEAEHLGKAARHEAAYIVARSTQQLLNRDERKAALAERRKRRKDNPNTGTGQNPENGLAHLRNRHSGFMTNIEEAFENTGTLLTRLPVDLALSAVYESLWLRETKKSWSLPTSPLPLNMVGEPDGTISDLGPLFWPRLGPQMAVFPVEKMTPKLAKFGRYFVAGVDITVGPEQLRPFSELVARMWRLGIPFRVSFKISSGGARGLGWRHTLALIGSMSALGHLIREAFSAAIGRANTDGCVIWQASFATWGSTQEITEQRHASLLNAVQSWGRTEARGYCGDPREGALSSVLSFAGTTADTGFPPLADALYLTPTLAAKPSADGGNIFLTSDGALWPLADGGREHNLTIVIADIGAGKSSFLARKARATILRAGASRLPLIAICDIGASSIGFIEMVRAALPPNLRHLAEYRKIKADGRTVFNPLDTPAGCRYPPASLKWYQILMLTQIARPAEDNIGYEGMSELCGAVIEEVYRHADDSLPGAKGVNEYTPKVSKVVDEAIKRVGLQTVRQDGTQRYIPWYAIEDALFDAGEIRASNVAHRYAVPRIDSIMTVLDEPHIVKDYGDRRATNGETLINLLAAAIRTARKTFPMVVGATTYDPTARIVAFDLSEVVGSESSALGQKTTGVIYMAAMFALTKDWYATPDDVLTEPTIPDRYREYHLEHAHDIAGVSKQLTADEFQEVCTNKPILEAIDDLARRGPRHRIECAVAVHKVNDLPEGFLQLASTVAFLSAQDEEVISEIGDRYGLTAGIRAEMAANLGRRDSNMGRAVMLRTKSNHGPLLRLVWSSMGPIELWEIANSPDDVQMKRGLEEHMPRDRAIRLLVTRFPEGSVVQEIIKRLAIARERGDRTLQSKEQVIDRMIEELLDLDRAWVMSSLDRLALAAE